MSDAYFGAYKTYSKTGLIHTYISIQTKQSDLFIVITHWILIFKKRSLTFVRFKWICIYNCVKFIVRESDKHYLFTFWSNISNKIMPSYICINSLTCQKVYNIHTCYGPKFLNRVFQRCRMTLENALVKQNIPLGSCWAVPQKRIGSK